jgi:Putative DNA-binding domain
MKTDQQALVDALLGRGPAPSSLSGAERGLAAYRTNLQALSAQALAVPFERLREALGEQDFASLAWTFWRAHPPECGDLAQWGGALESFLVERAGEVSGLPDLARLDWATHRAERAADAELDVESLALLGTAPPEQLWLCLRPGIALISQNEGPVLVWREGWAAKSQARSPGEAVFVHALLDEVNLAEALMKGSAAEVDFDFGAWLQAALQHAWLQGVRSTPPNRTTTP